MNEEQQASRTGISEHLDDPVELDFVPAWIPEDDQFGVRLEKVTGRDLIERVPKLGSEEAVAVITEALPKLLNLWPKLVKKTSWGGFWLRSIPPLLRETLCMDFSPRYPEMLEAIRRLGLSVKMSLGGWAAAEELIGDHLWEQRMAEIRVRQRYHIERHREDPRPEVRGRLIGRVHAFDNRRYGRPRTSGVVMEWSRTPASRGLSPSEADRLDAHLTGLWEELDEVYRRRLSVPIRDESFEYSTCLSQERQIEGAIEKLVTGTSKDLSEYGQDLGRRR